MGWWCPKSFFFFLILYFCAFVVIGPRLYFFPGKIFFYLNKNLFGGMPRGGYHLVGI